MLRSLLLSAQPEDSPFGVLFRRTHQHLAAVLYNLIGEQNVLGRRMDVAITTLKRPSAKRDTAARLMGEGADVGNNFMQIPHRQTNERNLLKACLSAARKRFRQVIPGGVTERAYGSVHGFSPRVALLETWPFAHATEDVLLAASKHGDLV